MKIAALRDDRIGEFLDYCRMYRCQLDGSYLSDEDLGHFRPDSQNPTYVLLDCDGRITAAASLMVDEYHTRGRSGRLRILHSSIPMLPLYQMLLSAIVSECRELDRIFTFVPLANAELIRCIDELGFGVERYSFFLVRDNMTVPAADLPVGFTIRPFQCGCDEASWCEVRNAAFAHLKGNDTPISPDMVAKVMSGSDQIEGASLIMAHSGRAIGVIRGAHDEYDGKPTMNVGPLAILPEYQGRGLGRTLLRALLRVADEMSFAGTSLCVNAENVRALSLYLQEGFRQVEAVACYCYDLSMGS
ncbi:MAG: GNAT family N-acetyltransferase [Bacillota bacterium]